MKSIVRELKSRALGFTGGRLAGAANKLSNSRHERDEVIRRPPQ